MHLERRWIRLIKKSKINKNIKESTNLWKVMISDRKVHLRTFIKRNAHGNTSTTPTRVRNNNRNSAFEDAKEDAEEEECKCTKMDKPSNEMKINIRFDAENLSADEIDETICKCNEKHPESGPGAGAFKYASKLETNISILEIKIAEKEIEN